MRSDGEASAPQGMAEEAQASIEAGLSSADNAGPAGSPVAEALRHLRAAIAQEAEQRHDQSTPRGKLVVALAKHLAHIAGQGIVASDHPCTVEPKHVAKGTFDVGGPFCPMWELYVEEAEQAVKLLCMEWELAAEVLKVRWL